MKLSIQIQDQVHEIEFDGSVDSLSDFIAHTFNVSISLIDKLTYKFHLKNETSTIEHLVDGMNITVEPILDISNIQVVNQEQESIIDLLDPQQSQRQKEEPVIPISERHSNQPISQQENLHYSKVENNSQTQQQVPEKHEDHNHPQVSKIQQDVHSDEIPVNKSVVGHDNHSHISVNKSHNHEQQSVTKQEYNSHVSNHNSQQNSVHDNHDNEQIIQNTKNEYNTAISHKQDQSPSISQNSKIRSQNYTPAQNIDQDSQLDRSHNHVQSSPMKERQQEIQPASTTKIKAKTYSDQKQFSHNLRNRLASAQDVPENVEEIGDKKREERRQMILQRMEEEKQMKMMKEKMNKEGNRLILQIKENIKLKEQLAKQKDEAIIIPELERRKQILAQKRELSQPIRLDKLAEHQKKYEEDMKTRKLEKDLQKQEQETQFKAKIPRFPKSNAALRLEEEQKLQKQQQQKELELKKLQRQRQLKYADVVQEIFFREHPILPKPPKTPKKEEVVLNLNALNAAKLKKLDKLIKPQRRPSHDSNTSQEPVHKSFHEPKRGPIRPPKKYVEEPAPLPKPKQNDYLQAMKRQRTKEIPLTEQWEKIIDNDKTTQEYKYQNVLNNVQRMEQKAKEREQIGVLNGDQDAEDEANQLYIASIKAKLALLEKN